MPAKTAFNTFLLAYIILWQGVYGLKSLIIRVPDLVKSGDTVTLACNYDLEDVALYTIKWYRNEEEFYRFVPKESPPSRAFTMPHINVDITKSGPTEVTLREVRRELTGDYKCEVSADAPLFHTDIKMAHMTVVDVPNGPPSLEIEPKKVEMGKRITAVCRVNASDPPANITWFINDELVLDDHDDVRVFPTRHESTDGQHQTSKSRVEIVANRSFFSSGPMVVKCEGRIYKVWSEIADGVVRDETPMLAPVLLSTSSQTHENDDDFDIFGRSNSSRTLPLIVMHTIIFHLLLLFR